MSNYQQKAGKTSMMAKIEANQLEIDKINASIESVSVLSSEFDSLIRRRRNLRIENQSLKIRIENLGKQNEFIEPYKVNLTINH